MTYYPGWHGCMLGDKDAKKGIKWFRRVMMAQLIALLAGHPILGLFFLLPSSRFTRAMVAMMVYVMLLLQFYGQLLFWGTGNEGPLVAFWAWLIDFCLVWISEAVVIGVFAMALLKTRELEPELDDDPPEVDEWEDQTPKWELMCRQTIEKKNTDDAFMTTSFESKHLDFAVWHFPMLLGADRTADHFLSDKFLAPKEFRSKKGLFVCKLVYCRKGRFKRNLVIRWEQQSDFFAQDVKGFKATDGFKAPPVKFRGLANGNAEDVGGMDVTETNVIHVKADLESSSLHGNRLAVFEGGRDEGGEPLYLVGQVNPNALGMITGESSSTPYHRWNCISCRREAMVSREKPVQSASWCGGHRSRLLPVVQSGQSTRSPGGLASPCFMRGACIWWNCYGTRRNELTRRKRRNAVLVAR